MDKPLLSLLYGRYLAIDELLLLLGTIMVVECSDRIQLEFNHIISK